MSARSVRKGRIYNRLAMTIRAHPIFLALLIAACSGNGGGGSTSIPSPPAATSFADNTVYSNASGASLTAPGEFLSVTHHQLATGGQTLKYTATPWPMTKPAPCTGTTRA